MYRPMTIRTFISNGLSHTLFSNITTLWQNALKVVCETGHSLVLVQAQTVHVISHPSSCLLTGLTFIVLTLSFRPSLPPSLPLSHHFLYCMSVVNFSALQSAILVWTSLCCWVFCVYVLSLQLWEL